MPGAVAPPGGHFLTAQSPSLLRKGSEGGKTHDCITHTHLPRDRHWKGNAQTHTVWLSGVAGHGAVGVI